MKQHYPPKGLLLWKQKLLIIPLLFAILFSTQTYGQAYVNYSRVFTSPSTDAVIGLITDPAGNGYMVASFNSVPTSFTPTIPGTPNASGNKLMMIKFSPNGNIVWSRWLTTSTGQMLGANKMAYENGKIYCVNATSITNLPTTDGSTYNGGSSDIIFSVYDANSGALQTLSYLGGSLIEQQGMDIVAENGFAYVSYTTTSPDVPVTTGPAFNVQFDHVITKLTQSGSVVYSTYTGNTTNIGAFASVTSLAVHNGIAALATMVSPGNNFAVTVGDPYNASNLNDWGIIKLNADGSTAYRAIIGGSSNEENNPSVVVNNGEVYLAGGTPSTNYPTTDGSSPTGSTRYHVVTKLNNAGSVSFSSVIAGIATDGTISPVKFNSGSVYINGSNVSTPVINVTEPSTGGNYLVRLNPATGVPVFAIRYGNGSRTLANAGLGFDVIDGKAVCMVPALNVTTATTTDGTTRLTNFGNYLAVFSPEGKLTYGTYRLTGAGTSGQQTFLAASNNRIYTAGSFNASATTHYALTEPIQGTPNGQEVAVVSFALCPTLPTQNDIAPLSQTICGGGFTQPIIGNKAAIPSSSLPMLNRAGVNIPQAEISARYQWQTSSSASGPWTNISGAAGTLKDYSPPSLAETRYYRRLTLPVAGCGETPISTSAVAEVIVGGDNSPVITSSAYTTCVGTPVNIEATVSGGAAPYTYSWDNGISSTTNTATVTPTSNSVYTLTVTDNNGCQQKGQVVVNAYTANAGPDAVVCAGKPVRLGVAPPAGVAGIVYAWTPATDLNDATIAQPLATSTANTTYTLSMTLPITGGGTCNTTDNVNVTIVAAPATPNFAGNDVAVCRGGTASLGTTAEPGFTYTWSPGNYLNAVNASTATYNAGSGDAAPNPITYTLTAASGGCSFTDEVTVAMLTVDAGENVCGPRTVGTGDPLPNITGKTFLWEKISGPGTITGATNTANTTVSESLGSTTVYRLTISYLGASCFDEVSVPVCGDPSGCPIDSIEVFADHGCPSTSFGAVSLRARPDNLSPNSWTYSWSASPAGGISATTGSVITLTDNIERDVTVTVTSKINPAYSCTKTIRVNGASWALPTFTAQDHAICVATPVSIGEAAVAGYTYNWSGVATGDRYASNPTVTPAATTNYIVTVTEPTSGCTVKDTATVKVAAVVADPGSDWVTCSNAVIQLGSAPRPNYTYSWTPAVASYQDGTDNTSAQPKVLVAISQDFTLRATDTESGCFKDSTVRIVVDNSPTLTNLRDTTICRGTSAPIGNAINGNVTFAWSPATGLSSTTVAQPIANPTSTQTYTLVVTYYDAANAPTCTKSGTVTVTVNGPEIAMTDATVCTSAAPYILGNNATITGAVTAYSWSPALSVNNAAILNAAVNANPKTSQQYTLIVRDAAGCADTATTTLTATTTPPNAGSAAVVCAGSSIQLGDAANAGTCTWTVSPAVSAGSFPVTTGPNPVFTPNVADAGGVTPLTGIVYTFTCSQDIAGCVNTSTVTVTVRAFSLPAIPVQTVCTNASTTIGVTPAVGVSYSWSPSTNLSNPDAATTTVSNLASTALYTLTAVHTNGCVATTDAVIGINPTPAPTVTIDDVRTPLGTPAGAFNPQITPAAGTYTYSWTPANKVTDPYIGNTVPTENKLGIYNYSLSVTDGNGCTSVAPAMLRVENIENTLPVTLSSFTATTRDCGVSLIWKVESASSFSHFIVERSVGGGAYVAVKKVWYEFNRINYNYQDAETGNGKWSYRLKLVDIDGKFSYSKVVFADVKCTVKANSLKIYPNPASGVVYINSSKPVKTVVVYTLTGGQVLRKDFAQNAASVVTLPVSNLVTGVYLVQVIAQDGTSQPARLVKE